MTADATASTPYSFPWDAEGRQKTVSRCATLEFTYNTLGQRVEKNVGGVYAEALYDPAAGAPVGEYNRTSWTQSFVPLVRRQV